MFENYVLYFNQVRALCAQAPGGLCALSVFDAFTNTGSFGDLIDSIVFEIFVWLVLWLGFY